ncbi:MAG: hotdog fold thioesterase [Trueperaceae bacterium]
MSPDERPADVTPLERLLRAAEEGAAADAFLGTMPGTLLHTLGIEVHEARPDRVVASMRVGPAHHQPYGLLHGGASVALAETVASIGSSLLPSGGLQRVVGLEINANHIRSVRSGTVTALGTPLHQGRSTQVWSVEITDEDGRLVCVSRCTLAVLE